MQPGTLRKRAKIQRPVIARELSGEQTQTWETVATRWVSMKYLTGTEQEHGAIEVQASQRWMILARWETSIQEIAATWQLVIDGMTYRVEAVDRVSGISRDLRIFCRVDD